MANQIPDDFYRIGSVAALTGIAVERLRAWERRHGFSPAHKNGRTRFYSADQLEKLKTIKHLIDRGQTVSSVINLSESQLNQRVTDQPAPTIRAAAAGAAQEAPAASAAVVRPSIEIALEPASLAADRAT